MGVDRGTEGLWGTLLPGALGRGWAARVGRCPRSGAPGRGEGGGRGLAVIDAGPGFKLDWQLPIEVTPTPSLGSGGLLRPHF